MNLRKLSVEKLSKILNEDLDRFLEQGERAEALNPDLTPEERAEIEESEAARIENDIIASAQAAQINEVIKDIAAWKPETIVSKATASPELKKILDAAPVELDHSIGFKIEEAERIDASILTSETAQTVPPGKIGMFVDGKLVATAENFTIDEATNAAKHKMGVHFSSDDQTWETPPEVFTPLNHEFNFTLDPCCSVRTAKAPKFYTEETNGLLQDWEGETVFVNPPYNKLGDWIAKSAIEGAKNNTTVVMLIPGRSDTKAYHKYIYDADKWDFRPGVKVRQLPGRIKFLQNGKRLAGAPFPAIVVIFKKPEFSNFNL